MSTALQALRAAAKLPSNEDNARSTMKYIQRLQTVSKKGSLGIVKQEQRAWHALLHDDGSDHGRLKDLEYAVVACIQQWPDGIGM